MGKLNEQPWGLQRPNNSVVLSVVLNGALKLGNSRHHVSCNHYVGKFYFHFVTASERYVHSTLQQQTKIKRDPDSSFTVEVQTGLNIFLSEYGKEKMTVHQTLH